MTCRRLLDLYDSSRVSQYEHHLRTTLEHQRELTVPRSRTPVKLTTASCYVRAAGPQRTPPPLSGDATQQEQDTDEQYENDDNNEDVD